MSEDVKDFLEELKEYSDGGISGLYPPEETVKEFIEYNEQLQQQNEELKKQYSKLEDKYIKSQPCCNEDDCALYKENKELKKYCCKRNDCGGRLKENHKPTDNEVLTEFEKWLEDMYNYIGSTDVSKIIREYYFIFNIAEINVMLNTIEFVAHKLQELKEGKK